MPEHYHHDISPELIAILKGHYLSSISKHRLFEGLSSESIDKLFGALMVEDFEEQEIVCKCPPQIAHHDAFLVLNGTVAIKFRTATMEHVLELAGFGTIFNIEGMLGLTRQDIGVRALGHVEVMMMDVQKLQNIFSEDTAVGYLVMKNLAKLSVEQHRRYLDRYVQ